MGAVAPVAAGQRGSVYADGDDVRGDRPRAQATWRRRSRSRRRREAVSTESLKVQQPFLVDLTTFGKAMTPATASLKEALPAINPAIEAGTQTLKRTPSLNAKLQQVMNALKALAQAPGTNIALNGLTSTVKTLNPMVRYLGPYQTVCDDWNYWWTYLSEHISEETTFGFAQRALLNQANAAQPNNVGTQGATAPVNGGGSTRRARRQRVPARAAVRRRDRQPGQRRLRDRPARLPEEAQLLRSAAPQPRHRPAHPGRSGPDVPRPHARSGGRDVQRATPRPGRSCPPTR